MACQPGTRSGAAPASVAAADLAALLPESVGQGALVTEDQREVCRLSPWDDVARWRNPYPVHYRPAFACSLLLYLPPSGLALRFAVAAGHPAGETTGLPRSAGVTVWEGRASPPVVRRLRQGEFGAPGPDHVPFGPSLPGAAPRRTRPSRSPGVSIFGLSLVTTFSSASPELTCPHDPGSQPLAAGSRGFGLAAAATFHAGRGYVVPGASHLVRDARPGRILRAASQVMSLW